MRGRKPKPTQLKLIDGNPGKRAINRGEPKPRSAQPTCPAHLSPTAKAEWKRLARDLNRIGLLTLADRAALAAYCQCWGRWVEAEKKLRETPPMVRSPSGYVQQNPWMAVANKQLELMGRYMAELGLTPAARSRFREAPQEAHEPVERITRIILAPLEPKPAGADGKIVGHPDRDENGNRVVVLDSRL